MTDVYDRLSLHQARNLVHTPAAPHSPVDLHLALKRSTHASLGVRRPPSSSPGPFPVAVMNGCNGKEVQLVLKSTDTIAQLQTQLNRKGGPEWNDINLAFNGKAVMANQCLGDLGVKAGAKFVTYRRCNGG